MRTSKLYSNIQTDSSYYDEVDRASYKGIAIKTLVSLLITTIIAVTVGIMLPYIFQSEEGLATFIVVLVAGAIIAFIAGIVGRFSERAAKYCVILYSLGEGVALGAITALVEVIVPGAGWIAVSSTLAIFATMLLLYSTGIIRVGSMLRRIMIGMMVGMLLCALITVVVAFTVTDVKTYLGIMIAIEAFFLIYGVITLAFNFAEAQAVVEAGCSKNAEWSVALGMEISFIYIYLEVLRLILIIAQFSNRN